MPGRVPELRPAAASRSRRTSSPGSSEPAKAEIRAVGREGPRAAVGAARGPSPLCARRLGYPQARLPAGKVRQAEAMHAIVVDKPGSFRWTEVPDPEPGDGEVVVDVTAAAVNRADVMQRMGHYDPPPGASPYPGLECSGVISAVGPGVAG